jgi:hypothetical protein
VFESEIASKLINTSNLKTESFQMRNVVVLYAWQYCSLLHKTTTASTQQFQNSAAPPTKDSTIIAVYSPLKSSENKLRNYNYKLRFILNFV